MVKVVVARNQVRHRLAGCQGARVGDHRLGGRNIHAQLVQHDVIPELDDGGAALVDAPDSLPDTLRRDHRNRVRRRLGRFANGVWRGEIRKHCVELVCVHVQLHVIDVAIAQTRFVGERQKNAAVASSVGPATEAGGEVHLTDVGVARRPAYPRRQSIRRKRRGEPVAFLECHVDEAAPSLTSRR
jgi:hypothetical protein